MARTSKLLRMTSIGPRIPIDAIAFRQASLAMSLGSTTDSMSAAAIPKIF